MSYIEQTSLDVYQQFSQVSSGYFFGGQSKVLLGVTGVLLDEPSIIMPFGISGNRDTVVYLFSDISKCCTVLAQSDLFDKYQMCFPQMHTIVAYESGAVLCLEGFLDKDIILRECDFDMRQSQCYMRCDDVMHAWQKAMFETDMTGNICQAVSVAFLCNLFSKGTYGISAWQIESLLSQSVYSYASVLSRSCDKRIATHMFSTFNAEFVLQALDAGYCLAVSVPAGTVIPESKKEFLDSPYLAKYGFENSVPHVFSLVKDSFGAYLFVDECGVRIISKETIMHLGDIVRLGNNRFDTYQNGFLLVGLREDE